MSKITSIIRERVELTREDFYSDGDWAIFLHSIDAITMTDVDDLDDHTLTNQKWHDELQRRGGLCNRVSFDMPRNVQADFA